MRNGCEISVDYVIVSMCVGRLEVEAFFLYFYLSLSVALFHSRLLLNGELGGGRHLCPFSLSLIISVILILILVVSLSFSLSSSPLSFR